MIYLYLCIIRQLCFFLYLEMKGKVLLVGLGILLFVLGMLMLETHAVAVQQPSPTIYANSGQTIPFLVQLNTVNGKGYYTTISLSAQAGLTASANITAYPTSGTSTTNVTIPVGISVSGNPGVYQLNISIVEYNSSTAPQSVLASYKYSAYVHIISPQTLPTLLVASTTMLQQKSVNIVIPAGASGWYIKYKVLYPNVTVAQGLFAHQFISSIPSINVTVTPSATSGTTNATVTFNVSVTSNLKFGEIPVTIVVYEYLQGTNALYAVQVLHYNFFVVPTNVQNILVASTKFVNFTVIGHTKFGNISVLNANIPASILSIVKSGNDVQILFNDSFTGLVSFQSNVTPTEIIADGQKLVEGSYTVPANMPLGTWDVIGNTVYVYADPSNVTVVYPNTTTTSITTGATATSSATISVGSSSSSSSSNYATQLSSFYEQHKTLILVTIAFLFIIIIAVVLLRR